MKITALMKEDMNHHNQEALSVLVERGGVYHDIPGNSPREVLTGMIGKISLPAALDRDRLLEAALEREALMSTAIGNGIALPHPRNPIVTDPADQLVITAFLKNPVNWNALDGREVHTVILIVSASAKLHLHTLSRINFFCRQERFYRLLQNRSSPEELIGFIRDAEQNWGSL